MRNMNNLVDSYSVNCHKIRENTKSSMMKQLWNWQIVLLDLINQSRRQCNITLDRFMHILKNLHEMGQQKKVLNEMNELSSFKMKTNYKITSLPMISKK